jgi:bla regulator protein blaR1
LNWTPDADQPQLPRGAAFPKPDPNGPSLQDALQDQLGLKLESTKGPVDTVVIDHIEKPTPN